MIYRLFSFGLVFCLLIGCKNTDKRDDTTSSKTETAIDIQEESDRPELVSPETVVNDIMNLLRAKKLADLNKKYIHSDMGLFDLRRIGAYDTSTKLPLIEKETSEWQPTAYDKLFSIGEDRQLGALTDYHPSFDCGTFEWDREGFFISDSLGYPSLGKIVRFENEEGLREHSPAVLEEVTQIEDNSYRIVLTSKGIIFYITNIENRWYLTVLDRITTDCSA